MKKVNKLDTNLEKDIVRIVEEGNELDELSKHLEAINLYKEAWSKLPPPATQWEIASWIAGCLFNSFFDLKEYKQAKYWGNIELESRASDIDTGPLIDLGMVCYELEENDEAMRYFSKAYELGRRRAFQERPKKYYEFFIAEKNKS